MQNRLKFAVFMAELGPHGVLAVGLEREEARLKAVELTNSGLGPVYSVSHEQFRKTYGGLPKVYQG